MPPPEGGEVRDGTSLLGVRSEPFLPGEACGAGEAEDPVALGEGPKIWWEILASRQED